VANVHIPKLRDFSVSLPPGPARNLTIAAGVLALLGSPVWFVYSTLADQQELKARWTVAGPPCPPPAPPPIHPVRSRGDQVFEYGEVQFSRQSGAVNCAAVPDGGFFTQKTYRVCQFTAPGKIGVATAGLRAAFEPGNRPATVTVRHGAATCVLGGWFRA
jgi:hypothetical protein